MKICLYAGLRLRAAVIPVYGQHGYIAQHTELW